MSVLVVSLGPRPPPDAPLGCPVGRGAGDEREGQRWSLSPSHPRHLLTTPKAGELIPTTLFFSSACHCPRGARAWAGRTLTSGAPPCARSRRLEVSCCHIIEHTCWFGLRSDRQERW